MNLRVPTNFPTGDRRTIRVALPADPLYDPSRPSLTPAPLHIAERVARQTLAMHETTSIHDEPGLISAAVALDTVLRGLLDALAAERAA